MATTTSQPGKSPAKSANSNGKTRTNGNGATARPAASTANKSPRQAAPTRTARGIEVPSWATTVASVVGVGAAIGVGLFATRKQWLPQAEQWAEGFSAALAHDETDPENLDQTRHAGKDSMRDDPGADWEEVDDYSDASFPASDPPSFNPGTA